MSETSWGGAWKTCPQCGKMFFCTDCENWVYQMYVSRGKKKAKTEHFCKYSCKLKFEREYEEKKKQQRIKSAKKEYKKRGKKLTLDISLQNCANCMYYHEENDKRICSLYRRTMNRGRAYPTPQTRCEEWSREELSWVEVI